MSPPGRAGAASTTPGLATQPDRRCCDVHCNSLWSIWYGLLVVAFQAFIVYKCVAKFLVYIALPWPDGRQPYLELNLYVGLVGAGLVLMPFFFIAFLFKIGNLANDGYKLGFGLSACAMDPPSILTASRGLIRNAWHHGGPTAPFIHLVSAFCFILPKIFIEARLIDVGFLSQDHIWKTDLNWLVPHQDRLVILHFLTGGAVNASRATTQAPYHHPAAQIREYLAKQDDWWPFSPEFVNYGLALVVYAVRYPVIFWNTNKAFALVFSVQLFANALQNLLAIGGISVMYKVQVLGPQNVLHKYEPFLLNPPVCMLLYILACVIMTASSCVMYMYGYHKFMAFLETEREKKNVVLREANTSLWAYFPHCSAMCVLIALAVCFGPLLYDFTLVYKGSLDGAVLSCVIATILHLFLWIVVWLFLTVKQSWRFKLRVTVGHAVVNSARSIKLLNDVDLRNDGDDATDAMMIVAFGRSFTVCEPVTKKLIMNTLARAAIERDKALESEDAAGGVSAATPLLAESRMNTAHRIKTTCAVSPSVSHGRANLDVSSSCEGPPSRTIAECQSLQNGRKELCSSPRLTGDETDCAADTSADDDDCDQLPPPPDHVVSAHSPRPHAPKKTQVTIHNPDLQDVHTPRSNRSVDSGLPHDDITPRSDSLSTASSSASPPDLHHGGPHLGVAVGVPGQQHPQPLSLREIQQQHRKSNSLDDINLDRVPAQTAWKSGSLQRGVEPPQVPPTATPTQLQAGEAIYSSVNGGKAPGEGTLVIRRKTSRPVQATACDDEDPYGRCLNMKLISFSEDPRIIDLPAHLSAASSQNTSLASTPRQGSPVHYQLQQQHQAQQFNTLPAQHSNGVMAPGGAAHHPGSRASAAGTGGGAHNTLPARVNGLPPQSPRSMFNGVQPTGRHFKPFDHRRMNPMAEIQETYLEYGGQQHPPPPPPAPSHPSQHQSPVFTAHEHPTPYPDQHAHPAATTRPASAAGGSLIVHKSMHLPHMPAQLRHTNYSSTSVMPPAAVADPRRMFVVDHQQRDSANFSLASSDSG